jgi:hypothetical protein
MKIAAFFHTRAFVIAAASLAAIAILIVVVTPAEPKIAEPRLPAAPAAQPAPDPEARAAGMTAPDVIQPILEPQRAPHPPANSFLETVYPPSRLPDVATAQGATISLACLARNGADLSKPMPSKHTVFAANAEIAARLRAWAQANGFEVRDSETLHGHTGTPEYRFDLVRVEVPIPENIEREGRLVLAAVQQIPGAYYQTWSGEIVR